MEEAALPATTPRRSPRIAGSKRRRSEETERSGYRDNRSPPRKRPRGSPAKPSVEECNAEDSKTENRHASVPNLSLASFDDVPLSQRERIDNFVEKLKSIKPMERCFNPYNSGEATRDAIRCNNLRIYLNSMARLQPLVAIIGEAPGYRGCHWSGVPFSSERIIMNDSHVLFGSSKGYRPTSNIIEAAQSCTDGGGPKSLVCESSATILWKIIFDAISQSGQQQPFPLFWNAFPLHPFKSADLPMSNRTPSQSEIDSLEWVLRAMLLDVFEDSRIKHVVALGRKAEKLLMRKKEKKEEEEEEAEGSEMVPRGVRVCYVRHPSQGGKRQCEEGLKKVFALSE